MVPTVREIMNLAANDEQEKLSVYPEPDKETYVVETTTELERQSSKLRQTAQKYTGEAFRSVRSGVDSVVNVEHRVESMSAAAYMRPYDQTYV